MGSLLPMLSDSAKAGALVLGFFGQFAYGAILILSFHVYPIYPLAQQQTAAIVMFAMSPVYGAGVVYLILRNPRWIAENPPSESTPRTKASRFIAPRGVRVLPATLTILRAASLVGFYGASGIAVALAPVQPPSHGAVVYIAETPLSWNYSPQNITVVIGVNNTVTWISHSLSYDTVTGEYSGLSSSPIAPGQTFSYTFTQPGVYKYYCLYHPWMVGSVAVRPPSAG